MGALLKNVFACRTGGFSKHLASVATMLKSYLIKPSQKCWKPFYKHKIQMGPQNGFTNLNKKSSQFAPKCRAAVSHKWAFKRGLNCWDYIRTVCLLFWNTVMFLSTELPSRNFCVRERMRTTKHHCYKPSFRVLLLKSSIWAMTFKYLWIEKRLKETPSSIMTWTALCRGGLLTIRLSVLIIESSSSCCCYTNKYGVTWKAL